MTPAPTDIAAIESQARALRAAYMLRMIAALAARLRPGRRAVRA